MGIFSELQNRLKNSGLLLVCILLFIYFGYHAVNGERGFLRYMYLRQEITEARRVAENYHNQKVRLEDKVRLLSSSSLDLDLLEERARVVLNMAGPDEFIILDEGEAKKVN